MDRFYVPLVSADVQPQKNALRPGIEGTTRSGEYPPYEIPLLKHRWGMHAEVTERPFERTDINPMWELVSRQGVHPFAVEENRLKGKYGETKFHQVYPVGTFARILEETAQTNNEWLEEREATGKDIALEAAATAAGKIVDKAAKAVATQAMKRLPGRPRKEVAPVSP